MYANLCSRRGAWVDCTFQLPVANHSTFTRPSSNLLSHDDNCLDFRGFNIGVLCFMVDSPISVSHIAIFLRLGWIICRTPFDLQLGFCANVSAPSQPTLFPPVRAPTLSVVTTVFWTDAAAGCLFQIAAISQWTINDRIVT